MDARTDTGMIEGRRKAAEELLASTTFKDGLRLFLKNIDPDAAPGLVRTLMGTDAEVPLALMSAFPAVANCLIKAAMEFLTLLRQYPAPMFTGMVEALLQDIDADTLLKLIGEARDVGRDLSPVLNAFAQAVADRSSGGKELS